MEKYDPLEQGSRFVYGTLLMDQSQEWPAMVALLKPRRRSLHTTITPAFGLSLVPFGLVSLIAYKSTDRLIAGGNKVAASNEVLAKLADALSYLCLLYTSDAAD